MIKLPFVKFTYLMKSEHFAMQITLLLKIVTEQFLLSFHILFRFRKANPFMIIDVFFYQTHPTYFVSS